MDEENTNVRLNKNTQLSYSSLICQENFDKLVEN